MTRPTLAILALVLLAAPAPAQEGGPQVFTQEQGQRLQAIDQELRDVFRDDEYEKGLGLLAEQREILEKGLARVKDGSANTGEDTEAWIRRLETTIAGNWYNVACCLSMTGRKEEAIEALGTSIRMGYVEVDHMKLDEDLDNIRNEPGYKQLIESLGYNEVLETHVPEGVAENAPLLVVLHSRGGNETRALDLFKPLAEDRGMVLAAPRGPITLTPENFDWRRYSDDEEAALKKIAMTIGKVSGEQPVDASRVYLAGAGNGGYFATLYALLNPKQVAGVVSVNAYWNKYYFEDSLAAAAGSVAICLVHGSDAPFLDKAQDGVEQMKGKGVAGRLIEFEGGKELPEDIVSVVGKALDWIASTDG